MTYAPPAGKRVDTDPDGRAVYECPTCGVWIAVDESDCDDRMTLCWDCGKWFGTETARE